MSKSKNSARESSASSEDGEMKTTMDSEDVMTEADGFVFSSRYTQRLLRNKHIVIMGDSVFRGVYKDLVGLLQGDDLVPHEYLKTKGEPSFMGDSLCFRSAKMNHIDFEEVREFATGIHVVQFYFITRCYNDIVEHALREMDRERPDIIIFNSCLWDLTNYERDASEQELFRVYRQRLTMLMERIRMILPKEGRFIWLTTPPLHSNASGGFLGNEISCFGERLRIVTLEANLLAAQVAAQYGYDVLDLNYFMRTSSVIRHRVKDGVHWTPTGHRHITNMILAFLMEGWQIPFPAEIVENFQDKIRFVTTLEHLKNSSHSTMAGPLIAMLGTVTDMSARISLDELRRRRMEMLTKHYQEEGRKLREREEARAKDDRRRKRRRSP